MTPADLGRLTARPADARIAYGQRPDQFGELRLPDGPGPFPVVVLIHGGCWMKDYANLQDLAPMADALKAEGIASWNIEYRRLPSKGSGWPGTYRDVGGAIDHLRTISRRYPIDLSRVVVLGHSAGAHLAHWSAARSKLDRKSQLYVRNPLKIGGVVNLAGRVDMAEDIERYEQLCRAPVVRQLLGGMPATVSDRYNAVSPFKMLPLGTPQVMIWGEHEEFVPRPLAQAYVDAANKAGDNAQLIILPSVGHFETASPESVAWPSVKAQILSIIDPTTLSAR